MARLAAEIPRTPLRVLIALPNLGGGGIEIATLNLLRGMDRSLLSPTLLVHERAGRLLGRFEEFCEVEYVAASAYSRRTLPRIFARTFRAAQRADVLLAMNEGRAAAALALSARLLRKPIVGVINFDWTVFIRSNSWRQRVGLRLYRSMSRVIAVSQGAADGLVQLAQVPRQIIDVISVPQPLDYVSARATEPLPERFRSVFAEPCVVSVGRLEHQKGFDVLIRAWAEVLSRGVKANLVIVGDGGLKSELIDLARNLNVAQRVVFAGFLDNPFPLVRAATVFALTSRLEGQPLALAEALACGRAVVAADCKSGPREVLDGGRYGVLVPVEDVPATADALAAVLVDSQKRQAMETAAASRAAMFDSRAVTRQWESAIIGAAGAR